MLIYIVVVNFPDGTSKVNQEGWRTLVAAQKFIESRSGSPRKINNFRYWVPDGTEYLIHDIPVHEK